MSRPGQYTHTPGGTRQYSVPEDPQEAEAEIEIEEPQTAETQTAETQPRKLLSDEERETEDLEYIQRWTRKRLWAKRTLALLMLSPLALLALNMVFVDLVRGVFNRSHAKTAHVARHKAMANMDCTTIKRGQDVTVVGFEWTRRWTLEERHTTVYRGKSVPSIGVELHEWRGAEATERLNDAPLARWHHAKLRGDPVAYNCGSRPGPDGPVNRLCSVDEKTDFWEATFSPATEAIYTGGVSLYEYSVETWEPVATAETSGTDHEPLWSPEPEPTEDQRLIYSEQTTVVLAQPTGEHLEERIPPEAWQRLALEDTRRLVMDGCGASLGLEP